jgi:O-antigen/teichoic acid export membrane protein
MTESAPPEIDNQKNRLLGGVVGQLGVTGLSIAQQILLVPLFVKSWDANQYAGWLILFSISALVAIADFGLHPLSVNRYQASLALSARAADVALSREIRNFLNSYTLNAICIAVAVGLWTFFLKPVELLGLRGASDKTLLWSLVLSIASGALVNFISGCSAVYRSHLEVARLMMVRTANQVAQIVAQVFILLTHSSVLAMISAVLAINFLTVAYMCFAGIPAFARIQLGAWWRLSWTAHIRTMRAAIPFAVPAASEPLLNQGPVFILGLVGANPASVIVFSLSRVLVAVPRLLVQQICGLLGPEVGARYVRKDNEGIRGNLRLTLTLSAVIIGVSTGAMTGLLQPLFEAWTQGVVSYEPITVWLLVAALVVSSHSFAAFSALLYCNQPGLVTKLQLARVAAYCLLTGILGKTWGASGTAAGLLIAEVVTSAGPFAVALVNRFPIRRYDLVAWSVVPNLLWFTIFAVLSRFLVLVLDVRSAIGLAVAVSVVAIAACAVGYREVRRLTAASTA